MMGGDVRNARTADLYGRQQLQQHGLVEKDLAGRGA